LSTGWCVVKGKDVTVIQLSRGCRLYDYSTKILRSEEIHCKILKEYFKVQYS